MTSQELLTAGTGPIDTPVYDHPGAPEFMPSPSRLRAALPRSPRLARAMRSLAAPFSVSGSAGDGLIFPWKGYPDPSEYGSPIYDKFMPVWLDKARTRYLLPRVPYGVWIDPQFKKQALAETVVGKGPVAYDAIREFFCCTHAGCGLWFYETSYAAAGLRLTFGSPQFVLQQSTAWQCYGVPNVGGVYYAMKRGVSTLYLGTFLKPAMAGGSWTKPLGFVNMLRITAYAVGYLFYWWGLQEKTSPYDFADPTLGAPVIWPSTTVGVETYGRGGYPMRRLNSLTAAFGPWWLDRVTKGY